MARRPVRHLLIAALVVFIAGNSITLLSTDLPIYIASRCIAGLGAGLFLPIAVATATQLVEPDSRGRAIGLIWGSNSAGAVVGVPIGLYLAEKMSWRAAIGLILILGLTALVGIAVRQMDLRVSAPPSFRQQVRLLADRQVLSVIGITLLTATGCLGLYAYIAPILSGTANSSTSALSVWNLGGLIGSTAIGSIVDRTGKPRWIMATILGVLIFSILVIPTVRSVSGLGLLPFLTWGAMGWATITPQQCSLIDLQPGHDAALVALNSSAVSLGSIAGATLGGLAITGGLDVRNLPYAASSLLLCALLWQLSLIHRLRKDASA